MSEARRSKAVRARKHDLGYVALLAVTLLAAVLRIPMLGRWSLWIDEAFTIGRVQANVNLAEILRTWWQPSLSVILTGGAFHLFGVSEWSARLVAVAIGILSVPVLYLALRKPFGSWVALLAVVLLALSPWHIYWSQNARFYTSAMLLTALSMLACYAVMERDRPWHIVSFYLLLFFAMGERLIVLLAVPAVPVYLLLLWVLPLERPKGWRARNLALQALPAVLFAVRDAFGLLTSGPPHLAHSLEVFGGNPNHSAFRLLASIAYRLGVPLICLALVGGVYLVLQKNRAGLFALTAAVVPVVLLTAMAPFAFTIDRYIFTTLPFWMVLAAAGVHQIYVALEGRKKLLALGVLAALAGTYLGEDVLYFTAQNGNRPDWRGAFAIVERRRIEGDLVLATRPELGHYYLDREVRSLATFDPDAAQAIEQRIWFVIDEATSYVDPATEQWLSAQAQLVDVLAISMPSKSLNIRIYLYDPADVRPF